MAIIKKMSFKRVDSSGNTEILLCFSDGKIRLTDDKRQIFSLSNIMFNSYSNEGYVEKESLLRTALKAKFKKFSEKNAKEVLLTLKTTTNLYDWEILEFGVKINIKEEKKEKLKKMSFKRIDPCGNTKILLCFSDGKIRLTDNKRQIFALSNIMFNSYHNEGYIEKENILRTALKAKFKTFSEKNAKEVLLALKTTTNLYDWEII